MEPEGCIPFMIKDISTSQEPPVSSKPPAMSSIFEYVLDAFKLNRFQPNFKQSFLRVCAEHPKCHQRHQPQSGTPKSSSTSAMSLIFERVLYAFKLNWLQPNLKHSFLRAYLNIPKCHQRHQPQSGTSTIIINSSKNSRNVIHLWEGSWCLQTQQISTKF